MLNFPFPTPPDQAALRAAERTLLHIAAVAPCRSASTASPQHASGTDLALTSLGHALAALPLPPRHGRVILEAATLCADDVCKDGSVVRLAVALAAALSAESPFVRGSAAQDRDGSGTASATAKAVRFEMSGLYSQHGRATLLALAPSPLANHRVPAPCSGRCSAKYRKSITQCTNGHAGTWQNLATGLESGWCSGQRVQHLHIAGAVQALVQPACHTHTHTTSCVSVVTHTTRLTGLVHPIEMVCVRCNKTHYCTHHR